MKVKIALIQASIFILLLQSCGNAKSNQSEVIMENPSQQLETATIGGGCFWCIEAIFQEVKGIENAISGYSGGHIKNPAYREVTNGRTGHAEVVQLTFNPEVISYRDILTIFFHLHDPTTLNRQGADVGTQYRSVIFYHNPQQETIARDVFAEIDKSGLWKDPLVTEISPLTAFYKSEDYHQNYFRNNPNQLYCSYVIGPKMTKLRHLFKERLH